MRFNREAENASQIAHPNVAAIYDFGETSDGLIYLAMEFVDGEPLTKLLEREGALPARRTARIVEQVASALEAAHDIGIVHRDLKPDNVMITRGRDGTDLVKVVDFGIAKAMEADDQNVTKTGLAIGTPEYMSPEQLGGGVLDARTDIYSLGLVTFNMLTGHLPFPTVTSREALVVRLTEHPRKLAEVRPDATWPASLQAVLDRALAQELASRYQRVTDLGRDLTAAVQALPDDGSGASRPTPTVPVTTKTPRIASTVSRREAPRSRLLPYLAGVTLVALVAAGFAWRMHASTGGGSTPPSPAVAAEDTTVVAPAGPDSTVAAASDSAAATPDSSGATNAATVLASAPADTASKPAVDSAPRPTPAERAPAEPPPDLDELLDPIRDDIAVGSSRLNDGEYEGATVRFRSAADRLDRLARRHPRVPEILALRREVTRHMKATRDACQAERDIALQRGDPAPECR
jgi:serine/threonine-protein kinase